jgi:Reverse transcriptase (RNA-dependent DNA polymerase)
VAETWHGRVGFVSVRHAGGLRVLTLLEPAAREAYLALVAPAAPAIEGALHDCVVANRVAWSGTEPPEIRLRPWRLERRVFSQRLRALTAAAPTIALADVRRCYASIAPSTVARALGDLGIETAADIAAFLGRLERAGGRGLPVGPEASAVVANAVLARADDALLAAGIRHLRWVDDVVIAADDPYGACRALDALAAAVAELGLRLNATKTRIMAASSGIVVSKRTCPR